MNTPLRIGVTGGIGSGKTLVCRIFEVLGIPVYYSDLESRQLTEQEPSVIQAIKEAFGAHLYTPANVLDKKALAAIVFADKHKLEQLNAIVHPHVRAHFIRWCERQTSPYLVKEAAILFESGAYKDLDYVITVSASLETRIRRVMERDHASEEAVRNRISRQMTDGQREEMADFVIRNDEVNPVLPEVLRLHHVFLEKTHA
jgi:dephospho-CoA kinase